LSCSRPSERNAWARRARAAAFLLAAAVLLGTACKDEIAPPTQGTVEIRLTSAVPGGYEGTRIYEGDELLVEVGEHDAYEIRLPAGVHHLRAVRDCAQILPAETLEVVVAPGRGTTATWSVALGTSLTVRSNVAGASIRLDGVDTGKITPHVFGCLPPGETRVGVELLGTAAVDDSTVIVDEGAVTVDFELEPLAQPRTALLEIYTATYCPNCGPADAAAESLWTRTVPDPGLGGFIGVQVHTRWQGRDSLATPTTLARNAWYGDLEAQGIPIAMIGGITKRQGAGNQGIEAIIDRYRTSVDSVRVLPTPVAIHWLGAPEYAPGLEAKARARVMLADGVAEADTCVIWGALYKDHLVTRGVEGPTQLFRHVVRKFLRAGTLADAGSGERGGYRDVEFAFPLDDEHERRPSGAYWSEEYMGFVVFVQNMRTREVLQAAHLELR